MKPTSLLSLLAACALLACGGSQPSGGAAGSNSALEALRQRAAAHPNDTDLWNALVVAEFLEEGGDGSHLSAALEHAETLPARDNLTTPFIRLERDGLVLAQETPASAEGWIALVDRARTASDLNAPAIAELAVERIETLARRHPHLRENLGTGLSRAIAAPGRMGLAAWLRAQDALLELAYLKGDRAQIDRVRTASGCVSAWRVAGPFGPHELLGFDQALAPEADATLSSSYDLGPGRGPQETRVVQTRACSLYMGGGPLTEGGTSYAEATINIADSEEHLLRVETQNAFEGFLDGRSVGRVDRRQTNTASTQFFVVRPGQGQHHLRLKVTTRHPSPVARVVLAPVVNGPNATAGVALPEASSTFTRYLRARLALERDDVVEARTVVGHAPRSTPFDSIRATVALTDPLCPADVRRDRARAASRSLLERDADALSAALTLAQLDWSEGHPLEAIAQVRAAHQRVAQAGGNPRVSELLAEWLLQQEWEAEAHEILEGIQGPPSCKQFGLRYDLAKRRDRIADMDALVTSALECDARSDARLRLLLQRRAWDAAASELERLVTLEPAIRDSAVVLESKLEIARGRGNDQEADQLVASLRRKEPRRIAHVLTEADRAVSRGRKSEAQAALLQAMRAQPAQAVGLRRASRVLGERDLIETYRLDGLKVIRDFESSDRAYDTPEVMVLDYTVIQVFPDGSNYELTHNIFKVQSAEAVDRHGEVQTPDGALVMTLRTVKPDGRVVEPDNNSNPGSVSLSGLSQGDYVELETLQASSAPSAFPNGYTGSRFYFKNFETPFDLSQLTMILPASMVTAVDPRGAAPPLEETVAGERRVLRWTMRASEPLVPEPLSVSPTEYIPSVRVTVGATWESLVRGLLDTVVDRDPEDPAARELLATLLSEPRGQDARDDVTNRATTIFDWVVENIEENQDVFGLTPHMLALRTGSRARVFKYLLGLAGIEASLAMARSADADRTEPVAADPTTFQHLIVYVDALDAFVWLGDKYASLGYMPSLLRNQPAILFRSGPLTRKTIEARGPEDHHELNAQVTLRADGSASVTVHETFTGEPAVRWRAGLVSIPDANLRDQFEEGYVARLIAGADLRDLNIEGTRERRTPLVFRFRFDVPRLARVDGRRLIVPGLFPSSLSDNYAPVDERRTPELLSSSESVHVRISLEGPDGTRWVEVPDAMQVRGDNGMIFRTAMRAEGSAVVLERDLRIPAGRVEPGAYAEFARFCRAVDEAEARDSVAQR